MEEEKQIIHEKVEKQQRSREEKNQVFQQFLDAIAPNMVFREGEWVNLQCGDQVHLGMCINPTTIDGEVKLIKSPIVWRVLEIEEGKALLLADKAIAFCPGDIDGAKPWEDSMCCFKLRNCFTSCFCPEERERILETEIIIDKYGSDVQEVSKERLFPLSISEYEKYFGAEKVSRERSLEDVIADFYSEQYQSLESISECIMQAKIDSTGSKEDAYSDKVSWWLRTRGKKSDCFLFVDQQGVVEAQGRMIFGGIHNFLYDVYLRPAMWVKLAEIGEQDEI